MENTHMLHEPLEELFTQSRLLILDFDQISNATPDDEDISKFFEYCQAKGLNPTTAHNRQLFNNRLLKKTNKRYLVSRYGEDRKAMLAGSEIVRQGRTIHLGIDIFCKDIETVYSPCDGVIASTGNEPESHSFGHYLIIRPDDKTLPYIFFGHMSRKLPKLEKVTAGQPIGRIGDAFKNENGGWSRHLHVQTMHTLPNDGPTPLGYVAKIDFEKINKLYPNPMKYFPSWIF